MKLEVTATNVLGETKTVDLYPEDINSLMGEILGMATANKKGVVCLTITRKDILKKFLKP